MMKFISICGLLLFASHSIAQQKVPPAKEVLADACKRASAEHKNILLIFDASWCVWCHKMDSSINNPACKKSFDDNYVIAHLTVFESPNKKNEEHNGAEDLLKQYGAVDAGIPFWVVLDKNGKLLKDSFLKNKTGKASSIGCPASEKEVAAFVEILKATSSIQDSDLNKIAAVFRKNDQH